MEIRRKFLVVLVVASVAVVALAYGVQSAKLPVSTSTPTIRTLTPKPTSLIRFEEAVEYALNPRGPPRWETVSEYRWLSAFEGNPFVTPDGLEEGYFEWRASNGTLYEAEYPTGKVHGKIEQFTGVKDAEEYYVWMIELKDGAICHIDARSGDFLDIAPSRTPGVLAFTTAARIINAPQKRVEEWKFQEYKRIGKFEFEPFKTPDGLVEGRLLWRTSDGTLYEVYPPFVCDTSRKALYIEVPDDKDQYNVWEITAAEKVYYIDGRNGTIRLVLPTHPTKLLPAYSLNITFPSEEGYISLRKGESITLPVAIKSLVDEPMKIRLVLRPSPSREEPLPEFITYEVEGCITVNPHETFLTQITIKISEDAQPGEYSFELTGELPVEGWGGEGYVFGLTILP